MTSAQPTAEEVEAVLSKRAAANTKPTDEDLRPVYNYLRTTFVSDRNEGSSTSASQPPHWYCSRTPDRLHREAATYLIFLFAFNKVERAQLWIKELEGVLRSCEKCSRCFASAKRKFAAKYMSNFPEGVRTNFFNAVNQRQATFIKEEYDRAVSSAYDGGGSSGDIGLSALPGSLAQLLLGEPGLLSYPDMAEIIDTTIDAGPTLINPTVTSHGLTPTLIHLLSASSASKRRWAQAQLPALSRQPLNFDEWCNLGIGTQVQAIYGGGTILKGADKWEVVSAIVTKGLLTQDTVVRGVLDGRTDLDANARSGKGLMAVLAPLLGAAGDDFESVFVCFTEVLAQSPTHHIWTFDPSPELPHTLFSDIKNNASFQSSLQTRYGADKIILDTKSKSSPGDALSWISDYLISLTDPSTRLDAKANAGGKEASGFGEALAKATSFCFSEMQHTRLDAGVRAAVARAGVEALLALQTRVGRDHTLSSFLSSSLDIHASFITSVALRPKDHPGQAWQAARTSARNLLQVFLSVDSVDIVECATGLATVAYEERLRQRKLKSKKPTGPPVKVDKLRRATIRRELWTMAYNSAMPNDPWGVAIFMLAVAPSAHIELLDRQRAWKGDDLTESISRDDWVDGIRAINASILATRAEFSRTLEAFALQPDTETLQSIWQIPGIPKAATILLLSPADKIHDPILTLISGAFDADERGDCFRELLGRYPDQAVDGLCEFLASFIGTALHSPESCSLAKWLVRCFTDILDALCQPSDTAEPLLNSTDFLSNYANGKSMSRRLQDLWHLMTTSLAVIFKRTQAWAPLYENDVMVDWMRDAIIFGRQMTEHTRMFEAAVLGQSGSTFAGGVSESPLKVTRAGKDLVSKLHIVLVDLVSWLRLTDVETLHQTFELLKDILERTSKSTPDLSQSPELEKSLLELDKFCRKATKSYHSRLSDDLLSELSELLAPFNLKLSDEDERLVRGVESISMPTSAAGSSSPAPEMPPPRSTIRDKPKPAGKNAFEVMMGPKGKSTSSSTSKASTSSRPSTSSTKAGSSSRPITIDDFEDDDLLSDLSTGDLDLLEKRAKNAVTTGKPPAGSSSAMRLSLTKPAVAPRPAASKLNINVVPKSSSSGRSGFKNPLMREMRKDHSAAQAERHRAAVLGGITPRLPAASSAGTGLGAYQPIKAKTVVKPDSGSSASDSSDEDEKGGLSQLIVKQKSPLKPAKTVHMPRSIQVMSNPALDALRKREDERARKQRMVLRLKPDLNPLYQHVLGWNPSHTGQDVPHSELSRKALLPPMTIPPSFSTAQRYEQVMLPMYLQELWMQALKDEGHANMPLAIEVTSRSFEDTFLDLEVAVAGQMPDRFSLNDSDIVILYQGGNPNKVFAKVVHYKRRFKDAGIKLRILQTMDQKELSGRNKWMLRKHLSLSTALREYAALRGLPYYEPDLLRDILQGRSAQLPRLSDVDVRSAMKTYDVNEPQAKAILGATSVEGFALIQGPPGTGKTKTISGLVGKWISERPNRIAISGEKVKKAKLLVCAPSNAAIDEVCKRLMNGVPTADGDRAQPNLVRIGMDSSVNDAVKDRSLDNLVEARVSSGMGGASGGGGEYAQIQAKLEEVKAAIRAKHEQIANLGQNDEGRRLIEGEFQKLVTQRTQLGQAASKAKDAARDATRHLEGARRAAKEAILDEADIVCATLSGAGQDVLAAYEFETVIIDEAAQAIEMSCLIPLKYGCKRCIMVGDPNQLPPTTFSTDAERFRYNESLFVRMARVDSRNMHLLSIQYRMHPYISELPSKVFYNSQLKDGPDMATKTAAIWHERHTFGPYRFFNVNGVETRAGTSTKNADEARAAVDLYRRLEADFGKRIDLSMRIGVITMYKEQLYELKRAFNTAFGASVLQTIEFNTVDGFQGQEKDIIILSTVRSGPNLNSIGFLKDARRMNVALTRAKSSLFVIGNAATLERGDERWKTIVQDARDRGFVINCDHTTFAPSAIEPPPAKVDKPIKRDKAPTSDRKPRISSDNVAPPLSVGAAASPLKRKSVETLTRDSKKTKVEVPTKVKAPAKAASSSSSSSSSSDSSDSDSDSSSGPAPPPKKAKTTSSKPSLPEPQKKLPAAPTFPPRAPITSISAPVRPNGHVTTAPTGPKAHSVPNPVRPPPPTSRPPAIARPPPPPPAPVDQRSLAFVKKKKKPNPTGPSHPNIRPTMPAGGTVRQQISGQYGGGPRRP